jgi:hypothetical protein
MFWPLDGIMNCPIHVAMKIVDLNVKIRGELQRLKVRSLCVY